QKAKEDNNLIDVTFGRKTRSVIIMDSSHVVLSCLQPETLQMRLDKSNNKED
ncbi:MAG: DUF370 domain-containing protein, partial [Finegoldia magna]|nr:DUF370 domain-containing protein [Finegoldia magna]